MNEETKKTRCLVLGVLAGAIEEGLPFGELLEAPIGWVSARDDLMGTDHEAKANPVLWKEMQRVASINLFHYFSLVTAESKSGLLPASVAALNKRIGSLIILMMNFSQDDIDSLSDDLSDAEQHATTIQLLQQRSPGFAFFIPDDKQSEAVGSLFQDFRATINTIKEKMNESDVERLAQIFEGLLKKSPPDQAVDR